MDNHSGEVAGVKVFGLSELAPGLARLFKKSVGRYSQQRFFAAMAIEKDKILNLLKEPLEKGYIRERQALALLSANMIDHPESGDDQMIFLRNAIRLYNATTFEEVCLAESAPEGSARHNELQDIDDENRGRGDIIRMSLLKQSCYIRDITKPRSLWEDRTFDRQFDETEIQTILNFYRKPDEDKTSRMETSAAGMEVKTTSALPVHETIATLQKLKVDGRISETQCGLMLCYILHAMDERKNGRVCYVDHPMAVAGYVQKHGLGILGSEEQVWKASLVALLHDIGEQNPALDLAKDLKGLLPDDVLDAVCLLHKKEGQPYFDYINQIATNPLAAFVKLCDLHHNSDGTGQTHDKQTYVYSLAAAYLQEMIVYPHKASKIKIKRNEKDAYVPAIEIAAFAQTEIGYTQSEFEWIQALANKQANAQKPDSLDKSKVDIVTESIFNEVLRRLQKEKTLYAYPCREEDCSLHL